VETRDFLDDAVARFSEVMARERTLPTRQDDRRAIESAIKDIHRAKYRLHRHTGPAGRAGLRVVGRQMAPALSVTWMRQQFPTDRAAPDVIYWPPNNRGGREPARIPDRPIDMDVLTLGQRIGLMERRGGEAIAALLDDIADALESGRRRIAQLPDGRMPLEHRAYFLAALAELWHRLDRRPTTGRRSHYGAFCEAVCQAIGWPTEGVNAALHDAIKLWRLRYR